MTTHLLAGAQHGFWHGLATWEGWNMTGALAGVAAALVIIPAVVRYFRDRHRPNAGRLSFDTYATTEHEGFTYHLGELSNGGGAPVSIVTIGFAHAQGAWVELNEQTRWWLDVGASTIVPFLAIDQQKAWMLVSYVGMDNTSRSRTVWMPLFSDSEAMEDHWTAFDAHRQPRWWRFWRWFRLDPVQPVGPGGAWAAVRKIRERRPDKSIGVIMSILVEQGGRFHWSGTPAEKP